MMQIIYECFWLSFLSEQPSLPAMSRTWKVQPCCCYLHCSWKGVTGSRRGEKQIRNQGTARLTCTLLHRGIEEDRSFPQGTLGDGDGLVPPGSHPGWGHRGGCGVFWGARVDLQRETHSGDPTQRGCCLTSPCRCPLSSTEGHGGHQ